jgi:hypothetical protein
MEQLNVITKRVDVLPMVKYYMDQLGIYGLFSKYVKKPERCTVDPAQILSVMVRASYIKVLALKTPKGLRFTCVFCSNN